jgi:uncharacterized protein
MAWHFMPEVPTAPVMAGVTDRSRHILHVVTLGMVLIGVVPATAVGASMPIIIAAAAGMFLATIWAARIGENASAGISSIVGSFLLSYALLVLGLTHNWYGIAPTAVKTPRRCS